MAEMRTEEETVQAIKDWWKKNGSSLLIGVGAALAIVFGWQALAEPSNAAAYGSGFPVCRAHQCL